MKIRPPAPIPTRRLPEFGRWYTCLTCKSDKMTREDIKNHLREKHGINPSGSDFQGTRDLVVHADAIDYSSWNSLWKIGDVRVEEQEIIPRRRAWR